MAEHKITKLFGEREIAVRVEELARTIADRVPGDFAIVGLLAGSFVFVADLIRALHRLGRNPIVDFMRLASYGREKESSRRVRLVAGLELDLAGRAVVLVDDIVDTGRTIVYACDLLRQKGASSVFTCALLDKPSRREVALDLDFVGFTIANVFVVGYGIDYAHEHRHLPFIGVIE